MPKNFFKRSVKNIWLISYISIFIIPIIFFGVVYYQTYTTFRNELIHNNTESIKSSYNSINDSINSMFKVQTKVNTSNRINSVAKKSSVNQDVQFELYEISKDINTIVSEVSYDTFIYFPNIDKVVSVNAITDINTFYTKYLLGSTEETDFYHTIANAKPSNFHIRGDNAGNILFYNKLPNGCTLFFFMNNQYIQDIVRRNALADNGMLYIYDSENTLLFSSVTEKPDELGNILDSESDVVEQIKVNKVATTAILIRSNSLKYLFLIPESFFFEKLFNVNITLIFSIILTLTLGILSIILLLQSNYKPLQKIMDSMDIAPASNEFSMISNIVESMSERAKELEDFFSKSQTVLHDSMVINLLTGSNTPPVEMLQDAGFFHESHFIVIVLSIEDYGTIASEVNNDEKEEDMQKSAYFIISNILVDVIGDQNKLFMTELDEEIVCIAVCSENDTRGFEEQVHSAVDKAQKTANQTFSISFYAGIGQVRDGYDEVIKSYKEAQEALEYKYLIQTDDIIPYKHLKSNEGYKYYYSQDREQQFANIIRTGDFESANQYLLEVIDVQTKDKTASTNLIKCFIFDVLGTIIKTSVNVTGEDIFVSNSADIDKVFSANKISEIAATLQKILKLVCDDIARRTESGARHLDLKSYINEHYHENKLNINNIGEYFGFAPSYISKLFKDNYHESMLDYLNRLRVEKAQNLLTHTSKNIDDIANMVGISNKVTFIRVFKKFTGLTPNKYRESQK